MLCFLGWFLIVAVFVALTWTLSKIYRFGSVVLAYGSLIVFVALTCLIEWLIKHCSYTYI